LWISSVEIFFVKQLFLFRLVLLRKSAAETVVMLNTAYGNAALSKTRVSEWFSLFSQWFRSGRPSTSRSNENVDKINGLLREYHRRTINQLREISGISWSSIQRVLSEDLHMRIVAAKFVHRLLRRTKGAGMYWASKIFLQGYYGWWIVGLWKTPGSPRPKKARQVKSSIKAMLIGLFDWLRTSKLLTRSLTWRKRLRVSGRKG